MVEISKGSQGQQGQAGAGLLTAEDVAALLRTTKRQVTHMRSRGQLPPGKKWPGLGVRWSAAEFHKWLEDGSRCG